MKKILYFKKAIRLSTLIGPKNIISLYLYRLSIVMRINPVQKIKSKNPNGDFYKDIHDKKICINTVDEWISYGYLFGNIKINISSNPPDWFLNQINKKQYKYVNNEWWTIPDFDEEFGDIKLIWEISRFDWVVAFAQHIYKGEPNSLNKMNLWLQDWCNNNPPYIGPNWKCGQEASIRIIHLAIAAIILGQVKSTMPALLLMVENHLKRIAPTINYSMAQDNNHGTSEAAGLFIGGSWLIINGIKTGHKWLRLGRKMLENRVNKLIDSDGSFSQYSVNYHRLMLDTLSIVEIWRNYAGLPEFSESYRNKVKAAVNWLGIIVDKKNGDAPNIGANDGAKLINILNNDYRDYRITVQLAMILFLKKIIYNCDDDFISYTRMLGIAIPKKYQKYAKSTVFDKGGYAVLKCGETMAVMRYPRFRFRPGHADAMHIDFWINGQNIFRDSGTYSYNTEEKWLRYFPGTESHNTIQFDDRDQMPRFSRFMFSDWLKTECIDELVENKEYTAFGATYNDSYGAKHRRNIILKNNELLVKDHVSGFKERAILRWRLIPEDWYIEGNMITNGKYRLIINSEVEIYRFELTSGWESRYYYKIDKIPVLEVEIKNYGCINTELYW